MPGSFLTSVVFDHLLLLEELGEVLSLGQGDDLASVLGDRGLDVGWDGGTLVVVISGDSSAGVSVSDADDVADFQLEARDVDNSVVDQDVAVRNHLSRLEWRSGIAESPHSGRQSEFEQAKEVQAGVARHSLRLREGVRELLLQDVVVTADNLFGQELLAIF